MVSRKSAFALTVMLLGSSVAQASAPASASFTLPSWVSAASAQSAAQSVGCFFQAHGKQMAYVVALLATWDLLKVGADKAFNRVAPTYYAKFHEKLNCVQTTVGLKKCNGAVPAECSKKQVEGASNAASTATATSSAGASAAADVKKGAEVCPVQARLAVLEEQNAHTARNIHLLARGLRVNFAEVAAEEAAEKAEAAAAKAAATKAAAQAAGLAK